MQDEKWQEIIGRVKDDFELIEDGSKELEEGPGQVEYIIFNGPLGKVKLERTSKPLVVDKKAIGSKRIGSQTRVEYIFSETEKVHTFRAYRWDDSQGSWVAMEAGDSFKL